MLSRWNDGGGCRPPSDPRYAERMQSRHTFIYRVLKPERATLSIVRGPKGDWQIGELQRRGNSGIASLTRDVVQSWLDEHALSA